MMTEDQPPSNSSDPTLCCSLAPEEGCGMKFPKKTDMGPCARCAKMAECLETGNQLELQKLEDNYVSTLSVHVIMPNDSLYGQYRQCHICGSIGKFFRENLCGTCRQGKFIMCSAIASVVLICRCRTRPERTEQCPNTCTTLARY